MVLRSPHVLPAFTAIAQLATPQRRSTTASLPITQSFAFLFGKLRLQLVASSQRPVRTCCSRLTDMAGSPYVRRCHKPISSMARVVCPTVRTFAPSHGQVIHCYIYGEH